MNSRAIDEHLNKTLYKLDLTINAVIERGYDDSYEDFDDYSVLLDKFEFRKLVTFEIYECYFYPKRHEFELQIVTDIVEAVVTSKPAIFLGMAALSGVVGNAIYDLLIKLIAHVISKFRKDNNISNRFSEIYQDIGKIHDYFESRNHANLKEIVSDLDIEYHKLTSLMKLLGFKCKRRNKQQIWIKPN